MQDSHQVTALYLCKREIFLDTYELLLQNNAWCFENGLNTVKVQVEVTVDNVATKEIEQTGHAVVVASEIDVEADINGSTKLLKKGVNSFCLASRMGTTVKPNSCHIFDQVL